MAQKYKEICTDFEISSATMIRDGGVELYQIRAVELSATPKVNPQWLVSKFPQGPWNVPKHVTGELAIGDTVRLSIYKGRVKDGKSGQYDNECYWEVKGDKDNWEGWNTSDEPYVVEGTDADVLYDNNQKRVTATQADTQEFSDDLHDAEGQGKTPVVDPERKPLPSPRLPGEYTRPEDAMRCVSEMRYTECVKIAMLVYTDGRVIDEGDINMTAIDIIAHKMYHLIERGPDSELLTAIEEGL